MEVCAIIELTIVTAIFSVPLMLAVWAGTVMEEE